MLKTHLPILVIVTGLTYAWAIIANRPHLALETPQSEPPLAQVVRVEPQTLRLNVRSQGVVTPRTEIDLVPEAAGQVIRLHPGLVAGGFFEPGEVLVAIDPRDYDFAVAEAQARIAEAKRQVAMEEAQAEQARDEWQALGEGRPTPLTLHEPQLAEARAKLQAAEADLAEARLQRSRCEWREPFAGRVREKRIGLGQHVRAGDKLARLYAIDVAEVRLPVAADQLAFLDLPRDRRNAHPEAGPAVILTAEFAGALRRWEGRIVRTEGTLDEATGLLHAVAEVRDPYARKVDQPPLMVGLLCRRRSRDGHNPVYSCCRKGRCNAVDLAGRHRQPVGDRQVSVATAALRCDHHHGGVPRRGARESRKGGVHPPGTGGVRCAGYQIPEQ